MIGRALAVLLLLFAGGCGVVTASVSSTAGGDSSAAVLAGASGAASVGGVPPVGVSAMLPRAAGEVVPSADCRSGPGLPDPTGTGGCVTPATAFLLSQVEGAHGPMPVSCWDAHAWNPSSLHPRGRGCDYTFGRLGAFPGPADRLRGWAVAEWLRVNAAGLFVQEVIWQGRIWSRGRAAQGWRPYGGGGVYDAGDATGGHFDHIHVSTTAGAVDIGYRRG